MSTLLFHYTRNHFHTVQTQGRYSELYHQTTHKNNRFFNCSPHQSGTIVPSSRLSADVSPGSEYVEYSSSASRKRFVEFMAVAYGDFSSRDNHSACIIQDSTILEMSQKRGC